MPKAKLSVKAKKKLPVKRKAKPAVKPKAKPSVKPKAKAKTKAQIKPKAKVKAKAKAKPQAKPKAKAPVKPAAKPAVKVPVKSVAKPAVQPAPKPAVKPVIKRITCEHLVKLENQPKEEKEHLVIDLRDLADYEVGHIEGSVHCPKKELTDNLQTLVPNKNQRVVVILGPTEEADIEAVHARLLAAGYKNTEYLAGGIDHYCEIADIDLSDVLGEQTDEERHGTDHHEPDIDPEGHDNEPLY